MVSCDGPNKLGKMVVRRDMFQLSETHPDIHAKFLKGNFVVVQKSPHKFSLIGMDQSHEQSNKSLQSHG